MTVTPITPVASTMAYDEKRRRFTAVRITLSDGSVVSIPARVTEILIDHAPQDPRPRPALRLVDVKA